MSKQQIRQQARQAARDGALRRRREREQRERRLIDLAEQVLVAVAERDAAVAEAERRVGAALREFTETEGLTLREAVEWCEQAVTVHEATQLRRLAADAAEHAVEQSSSTPTPHSSSGSYGDSTVTTRAPARGRIDHQIEGAADQSTSRISVAAAAGGGR